MKLVLVLKTARCAVIMAEDGSVFEADTPYPVSYTHLDVYKRQA